VASASVPAAVIACRTSVEDRVAMRLVRTAALNCSVARSRCLNSGNLHRLLTQQKGAFGSSGCRLGHDAQSSRWSNDQSRASPSAGFGLR
jgi:hypothetical protein